MSNKTKLILENQMVIMEALSHLLPEESTSLQKVLSEQFYKTKERLNPPTNDSEKERDKALEEKNDKKI